MESYILISRYQCSEGIAAPIFEVEIGSLPPNKKLASDVLHEVVHRLHYDILYLQNVMLFQNMHKCRLFTS